MKKVVPLAKARETSLYGSKAVGLGDAARHGLPVPPGVARSGGLGEAIASGDASAMEKLATADIPGAVREVWWSANSDSAITYRQRVGMFTRPSVGIVVPTLLNPTVAGVLFTENPVTGADERLI